MENDNNMIPICRKCAFQQHGDCFHPDASITDFINGDKECAKLNYAGQCKLYEVSNKAIRLEKIREMERQVRKLEAELKNKKEELRNKIEVDIIKDQRE